MASKYFRIDGVDELSAKWRDLRGPKMRAVYRNATRDSARPVLVAARQFAPFDTGALEGSLKLKAGRRSRRLIATVVVAGERSELGIPPGAKGYYPQVMEFGTKPGTKRQISPRPFLRPAMDMHRADSIRLITDRIVDGFRKVTQ